MPYRAALLKALLYRILLLSAALFLIYAIVITALVVWNFETRLTRWPQYIFCSPFEVRTGRNIHEIRLLERLKRLGYEKSNALSPPPGQYTLDDHELQVHFRPSLVTGQGIVEGPARVGYEKGIIKSIRMSRSHMEVKRLLTPPELLDILSPHSPDPPFMVQIPLDEMNPALIDAVILTEDVRFREHHGIDLTSILRAVKANWRAGRYVQGGSTIPQQLIKMTMLSPEKKMTRKILEASMAVAADLIYSKDTILKSYLNRVYLGHVGARPVQGVGEASRLYFAKKCSDLSVEECAMIAGMIKAPNVINPIKRPARARKRRNMILGLLRDAGKIGEPEYIRAANSLVSMRNPELISVKAKAFMDLIKARASEFGELKEKISKARVLSTTIDPLEQEKSNKVYRSLITDGQKGRIIRIDTVNGQIKAYAGSLKWSGAGGALDTISPFLALAALSPENGAPPRYTLTTPFYPSKAPRKPVTFTKAFHVHRKQLLDKLISGLGVARISRVLENCNIPFRVTNGRIELQPMTPMELACKYSVFPGLGRGVKPHFLITAESGPNFSGSQSGFKVPVQSSVIFLVNRLLKPYSLIQKRHGLSTGLWKAPSIIVSKESNGVWGIAYWHENLTLVRFSDTTLPLESVSAALEKLNPKPKHYVHKRYPPPNGLIFRKVCLESGLRATSLCARVVAAPFLKGTQPSEWCPLTRHESGP